jgi:malonyl-ACP O-methyltransferase BioC
MDGVKYFFNKRAYSYDKYATIQFKAGNYLINSIISKNTINRALDIGSGTGRITDILFKRYNPVRFDAIDISPEMINIALDNRSSGGINYICDDFIEFLNVPQTDSYDLIFSNMALQWEIDKIQKVFRQCYKKLSLNGELVFSIPLYGTFNELLDDFNVNEFYSATIMKNLLIESGFSKVKNLEVDYNLTFESNIKRLNSIRLTGANYVMGNKISNFSKLKKLIIEDRTLHKNYSLTYKIGYFKASK